MQYLGTISKTTQQSWFISMQTIQHYSNPSLCPNHWCYRSWSWWFYEELQHLLELKPKKKKKKERKKCSFHHRGLECKLGSKEVLVLPMSIQVWLPLGDCLIFLLSKRLSRVFSSNTARKHQFFSVQPSLWSNSHPYMTTGKIIALTRQTFVVKVICLVCNMLPSLVIVVFFPPKAQTSFNFMAVGISL